MWIGFRSLDYRVWKDQFSPEIERTAEALNNANLAVYPVDARGLMPNPNISVLDKSDPLFSGRRTAMDIDPARDTMAEDISPTVDTMKALAERTGGRAFYNSNDIQGAIRSAIDDSRLTYVLGYYPTHEQWNGEFRKIKVRVRRPGLGLRYRRGYFALPQDALDQKERKAALKSVVWSPLDATGIGVLARLERPETSMDGKLGITLKIDPRDITFEPQKDRWMGVG